MQTPAKAKQPVLSKVLLNLDRFGKPFSFRMAHGYTTHRSMTGGLASILLLTIMIAYSLSRLIVLVNHEDTKIAIWHYDEYLDDTFIFDHKEHNYNFAFGIFDNSFNSNRRNVLDEDYGSLKLGKWSWVPGHSSFDEISTRPCNNTDFGLDGS